MRAKGLQIALLAITALAATGRAAAGDPYAAVRGEFQDAFTAVQTGQADLRRPDGAALRAYPLYPYLQAARIERALAESSDGADDLAARFLQFYDVEPVGRDLRRAWLASLARRGQWAEYVQEYQSGVATPPMRCQYLAARIELRRSADLAASISELWLTPEQLPPECEPVFEWARQRGLLDDDLIEQRVRLLLGNARTAFARIIARRLPAERAAPLLHTAQLIEQPAAAIDALIGAGRIDVETDALFDAWARFARNDPGAALERYAPLMDAADFDAGQASRYALALALGLAWDRRPEAAVFFDHVSDNDRDDYALQWQTRSALWAGDWQGVERAIGAMSAPQREQARWRYWAARAADARGDAIRARELYAAVLGDDNYYSAMAAARLGRAARPHPQALPADRAELRAIAAAAPFVRARELQLCGLRPRAMAEWQFGYAMLPDNARLQAIHLAARWDWHDVAVATATRHNVFYDYALLYPQPYDREVRAAARFSRLKRPLIYAVIRQESLFHAEAASPAGALGLMQLKPDTARLTARRWGRAEPSDRDLFEPSVNVTLGAAQLRTLLERFEDQIVVALAGYNAGPNAAARWLPAEPIEADIWIENIPYNETRDYVQRVLWHSVVFAWLNSGRAQDTADWIAQVRPLATEQVAAPRRGLPREKDPSSLRISKAPPH